MPRTIATSRPQNQPALPTGLTTMFTITVASTTSSQREVSRIRRMRRCPQGASGPSRSIALAIRPPSGAPRPMEVDHHSDAGEQQQPGRGNEDAHPDHLAVLPELALPGPGTAGGR